MDAGALDWLSGGGEWMTSERMETLFHLVLSHEIEEDGPDLWLDPQTLPPWSRVSLGKGAYSAGNQLATKPSDDQSSIPGIHMVKEESSEPWFLPSLAFSCPRPTSECGLHRPKMQGILPTVLERW